MRDSELNPHALRSSTACSNAIKKNHVLCTGTDWQLTYITTYSVYRIVEARSVNVKDTHRFVVLWFLILISCSRRSSVLVDVSYDLFLQVHHVVPD